MKKFKKLIATMLVTVSMLSSFVTVSAEGTLDKNGEYNARLGLQAQTADEITWVQRLGYFHKDDGSQVYQGAYGGDTTTYYEGTFTDAVIKGNGTYTVSYTTKDIAMVERFTQLHVATDIPNTGELEFSDYTIEIGGREVGFYDEAFVDDDVYTVGDYTVLLAFNHWRKYCNDSTAAFDPLCIPTTGDITISLTFTVSGFDYDNPDQVEPAPEETPADTTTDAATPDTTPAGTTNDNNDGDNDSNLLIPIIIVVAVVVVAGVIIVVMKKKK